MKKSSFRYVLGFLVLFTTVIWLAVISIPDKHLHVIACDVGQGDAILISRGSTQVLIDGGPNSKVLECLARHIPFWDRTIEVVVLTHPQADHLTGLLEVFRRYSVKKYVESGAVNITQSYQVLEDLVKNEGAEVLLAAGANRISTNLITLDIVFPTNLYLDKMTDTDDLNNYSVVVKLQYREFDALFTGDIMPEAIDDLLATYTIKDVEYLKVPHHGSKNGLDERLLKATTPEVAVISLGKNNRFGHPHKEVINLLSDKEIEIYRTDEIGDVEIISDGKRYWLAQ